MINQPLPFKGLISRIPTIIPIKGRGFINHGSTLVTRYPSSILSFPFVFGGLLIKAEFHQKGYPEYLGEAKLCSKVHGLERSTQRLGGRGLRVWGFRVQVFGCRNQEEP